MIAHDCLRVLTWWLSNKCVVSCDKDTITTLNSLHFLSLAGVWWWNCEWWGHIGWYGVRKCLSFFGRMLDYRLCAYCWIHYFGISELPAPAPVVLCSWWLYHRTLRFMSNLQRGHVKLDASCISSKPNQHMFSEEAESGNCHNGIFFFFLQYNMFCQNNKIMKGKN